MRHVPIGERLADMIVAGANDTTTKAKAFSSGELDTDGAQLKSRGADAIRCITRFTTTIFRQNILSQARIDTGQKYSHTSWMEQLHAHGMVRKALPGFHYWAKFPFGDF